MSSGSKHALGWNRMNVKVKSHNIHRVTLQEGTICAAQTAMWVSVCTRGLSQAKCWYLLSGCWSSGKTGSSPFQAMTINNQWVIHPADFDINAFFNIFLCFMEDTVNFHRKPRWLCRLATKAETQIKTSVLGLAWRQQVCKCRHHVWDTTSNTAVLVDKVQEKCSVIHPLK